MAARKKSTGQHSFAAKVSEILEKEKIPEERRDEHGNPFIKKQHLPKLPKSIKSTLEVDGLCRICIRSYPQ